MTCGTHLYSQFLGLRRAGRKLLTERSGSDWKDLNGAYDTNGPKGLKDEGLNSPGGAGKGQRRGGPGGMGGMAWAWGPREGWGAPRASRQVLREGARGPRSARGARGPRPTIDHRHQRPVVILLFIKPARVLIND